MHQVFWRRELTPSMLPVAYPSFADYISPPSKMKSKEQFEEEMAKFEDASHKAMEENEIRLKRAMPWIKQCAMLHGMSQSFNLPGRVMPIKHRSWCPAPYWMSQEGQNNPQSWEWPRG